MSVMDNRITDHGESVEIHQVTRGSADASYGDRAVTWAKEADEYMWIQSFGVGGVGPGMPKLSEGQIGLLTEGVKLGFCLSTSVVAAQKHVHRTNGEKYEVIYVEPYTVISHLSYKLAYLKLMVE